MTDYEALEEIKKLDCIWISCRQAATVAGASENTLRQAIQSGKQLPFKAYAVNRSVYIHRQSLIDFVEKM